jgi:hypothetical protein
MVALIRKTKPARMERLIATPAASCVSNARSTIGVIPAVSLHGVTTREQDHESHETIGPHSVNARYVCKSWWKIEKMRRHALLGNVYLLSTTNQVLSRGDDY